MSLARRRNVIYSRTRSRLLRAASGKGSPVTVEGTQLGEDAFAYYPALARLKRFVDEHYAEPLTLADAAAVAGFERTYFSHFFHHRTGVRFRDWLMRVRVSRALELMSSRNVSITELAFAVGYQDLRTFERAFERCLGCSPRQARHQVRMSLRGRFGSKHPIPIVDGNCPIPAGAGSPG